MTRNQQALKKATVVKRAVPEKRKALAAPKRKQVAQKEVNPKEVIPLGDKDFEDF